MKLSHSRDWRSLATRSTLALCAGLTLLFWPQPTLQSTTLVVGVFAAADALSALTATKAQKARIDAWVVGLQGLIAAGVGLAALSIVGLLRAVPYLGGAWAVLDGLVIVAAWRKLRQRLPWDLLVGLMGTTTLLLGLVGALFPYASAGVVSFVLGYSAAFAGVSTLVLAHRLRQGPHARGRD